MARSSTSFGPGNTAAVTHGARSQRLRESVRKDLAQNLREHVRELLPDLAAADALLVDLLVDCLTDVRQLRDYVNAAGGPISPRGQLRKAMETLRAREHDTVALLDRLGVGPRARSQLTKGLGVPSPRLAQAQAGHRELLSLYGVRGGEETA